VQTSRESEEGQVRAVSCCAKVNYTRLISNHVPAYADPPLVECPRLPHPRILSSDHRILRAARVARHKGDPHFHWPRSSPSRRRPRCLQPRSPPSRREGEGRQAAA